MALHLSPERKGRVVGLLREYYLEQFDETLSDFRAEQLIDFFLGALGPQAYNQGVQDARGYMAAKLDDIEGDVYTPDE